MKTDRGWNFGNFEITKREIIVSISIIAVMFLIGVLISSKISDWQINQNDKYNKAVKIQSTDLFQYGMETNIGNAFVYGKLKAVDTVTYPEIGGKYIYVKKVKEKYTMHTRRVAHKSGKSTYYTTETYWTWDYSGGESKTAKKINFCGIDFKSNKIVLPDDEYIDTVKESGHIRYKYYGVGTKYTGTIFTALKNKTISDKSAFYNNKDINETVEHLESDMPLILFRIGWILLTGLAVFGFFYLDNDWLE
nr:MAG TPA: hypothetical protein [Caudoviricetes sp.]